MYSSPGRRAPPKRRAEEVTAYFAEVELGSRGNQRQLYRAPAEVFLWGRRSLQRRQLQRVFAGTPAEWNSCCSMMPRSRSPTRAIDLEATQAPHLSLLARFRPRNSCRPALRLSRYWAFRTRARPPFRSEQGSARPIRARCCRARWIFPPDGKPIRGERRDRDEKRSGRPQQLRLGGRCSTAAAVCEHGHLRDACRWLHAPSEFRSCAGADAGPTRG